MEQWGDDQLELRQLPTIYTGLSSRAHKMDNVGLTIRNVSLTCWLLLYSTSNTREGDIRGQCDWFFMVRWPVNCIFLSWSGDDLRRARSFSLKLSIITWCRYQYNWTIELPLQAPLQLYLFYILWFYIYYYILAYGHHYLSVTISLSIAQVILAYFIMLLQCYRTGVNHISLMLVTMSHHNWLIYPCIGTCFSRLGHLAWTCASFWFILFYFSIHCLASIFMVPMCTLYVTVYTLFHIKFHYANSACAYTLVPSPSRMLTGLSPLIDLLF